MENDESRIDRNDAERLINNTGLDGPKLTTFLAERTGILQKQSEDVFDFLHRSFQEFLAAQQIVADNDVTKVARQYGAEKSWRETICLLAGTAEWNDQQKLLNALLELAHKNTKQNRYFHLLAWEFWELLGETTQEANAIIQRHSLGLCKNQSLTLNLSYTQVTDLSPLAGLSELQSLDLMNTQVTDLSPGWLVRTPIPFGHLPGWLVRLQSLSEFPRSLTSAPGWLVRLQPS